MTDVRVPVGACRCPGSPHDDGDWVDLRPSSTIDMGAAVYAAVASVGDDPPLMQVELTRAYLRHGITAWSFTDAKDRPIPIRPRASDFMDVISELLPLAKGGFEVADTADGLYTGEVLHPLTSRLSTSSPGGRTDGSISPTPASSPPPPMPSGPSSPADTDGSPSADPVP